MENHQIAEVPTAKVAERLPRTVHLRLRSLVVGSVVGVAAILVIVVLAVGRPSGTNAAYDAVSMQRLVEVCHAHSYPQGAQFAVGDGGRTLTARNIFSADSTQALGCILRRLSTPDYVAGRMGNSDVGGPEQTVRTGHFTYAWNFYVAPSNYTMLEMVITRR